MRHLAAQSGWWVIKAVGCSLQVVVRTCQEVSAAARECAGSLRSPAELLDTTGVNLGSVQGVAIRPMSAVRAEKLERARCAY